MLNNSQQMRNTHSQQTGKNFFNNHQHTSLKAHPTSNYYSQQAEQWASG